MEPIKLTNRSKKRIMKIIMLGDGAVGKTSLRTRYLARKFDSSYRETIGADFAQKTIRIQVGGENTNREIPFKLLIWDISGQPRFAKVAKILFDQSDACLLVFDLSNRESLESLETRLLTYHKYAEHGIICLVGNKKDLRANNAPNMITSKEAKMFVKRLSEMINKSISYVETSAKTGYNIKSAFELLAKNYVESVA